MSSTSPPTDADKRDGQDGPTPATRAPGDRAKAVLWSLLVVALLALVEATLFLYTAGRGGHTELPVIGQAPHYRLINQNGKPVSSKHFAGKVQIVTALFPYCREYCPLVAANLAEFRDTVVRSSDLKGHVVFVFFNVAPADAGPAAMRTFLKQYGWDPNDPAVQFLTGPPKEIRRVVRGGYHIAYYRTQGDAEEEVARFLIENPLADRIKPDFDIVHADLIEVIDGAGRIRKLFSDGTRLGDRRLQSVIEPLLADSSSMKLQPGA